MLLVYLIDLLFPASYINIFGYHLHKYVVFPIMLPKEEREQYLHD